MRAVRGRGGELEYEVARRLSTYRITFIGL